MSVTLQTKKLLVNSDRQSLTSTNPDFFVESNALLRFEITDSNGDPVNLTGLTFLFGVNNSFVTGSQDLIRSDNSQFNISGDWTEANVTLGKICCRIDCTNEDILTLLGDNEALFARCSLWAIGTNNYLLAQFPCNIMNIITHI